MCTCQRPCLGEWPILLTITMALQVQTGLPYACVCSGATDLQPSCNHVFSVYCRSDCEQYVSSVWDWLEGLGTGISRGDPATWRSPHWPPAFKGIINCLEVSHQAFVWRVRGNPCLIKARPLSLALLSLMLESLCSPAARTAPRHLDMVRVLVTA